MEVYGTFPEHLFKYPVLHGIVEKGWSRHKPLPSKNVTFPYFCLSHGPNYNRKNIHKYFLRCGSRRERQVSATFDFFREKFLLSLTKGVTSNLIQTLLSSSAARHWNCHRKKQDQKVLLGQHIKPHGDFYSCLPPRMAGTGIGNFRGYYA